MPDNLHEVIIHDAPRRLYPENPLNLRTATHSVHCPDASGWCAAADGRCRVDVEAEDVVGGARLPAGRYLVDRDAAADVLVWYEAAGGVHHMHEVLR